MTKISIDDVKKLALLSRISISDKKAKQLSGQLANILDYVSVLNDIDTSGLEPTSQVTGLTNVERKDTETDYGTNREQLLANTPYKEKGYIKVKRVLK